MEKTFEHFIDNQALQHQDRVFEVLDWISTNYPNLEKVIKWNQPMFLDHGCFIIGFSCSKKHLAVSPEASVINRYLNDIESAGYVATSNLFRLPWDKEVDYELLKKLIDINILEKKESTSFWRV